MIYPASRREPPLVNDGRRYNMAKERHRKPERKEKATKAPRNAQDSTPQVSENSVYRIKTSDELCVRLLDVPQFWLK
jgi:hypothetical protein